MSMNRREFLGRSALLALSLQFLRFAPGEASAETTASRPAPGYGSWQDLYRERWKWDRVVYSSHGRANCISACSWSVFVKDGLVWREEQNAIYEASEPGVPDFNPRGCQKGGCYSHLMYEPSRLLHPIRRVGERGSGKWKRVSWDEALGAVADAMIDAAVESGTGAIVYDNGTTNLDFGPDHTGEQELFRMLGATSIESWSGVGDMPHGATQTWGMYNSEGTADDWFKSDFIVVWVGNPSYTRIPDVHFMHEARYRGAKLVVIAPDYNATAVHADYWINPRIGTDAALALAMAQVILQEDLFDADYVREQTDLAILVREDTRRYLRASDLSAAGGKDALQLWDEAKDRLATVPGCEGEGSTSLALGALRPALGGRREVTLAGGKKVGVRPLFEILREHLDAGYTPERAAQVTGVSAGTIRRIARELAQAGSAMIFSSWGACKHYHSDLVQRAEILLMALTGNQGKSGGGVRVASWWEIDGQRSLWSKGSGPSWMSTSERLAMLYKARLGGGLGWRELEELLVRSMEHGGTVPLMSFLYAHAGYGEVWDREDFHDPALPRPPAAYMKEAIAKGWIPVRPLPGVEPRVFYFTGVNPLRRWPAPQIARKHLWPKLSMIVNVNTKLSTSAMMADVVLPAACWYERDLIKYSQAYLPYVVLNGKAVEPLGESKSEWEITGLLAKKLQQRARERGVTHVRDAAMKGEVDVSRIYERWTDGGRHSETDPRAALDEILRETETTGNVGYDEASKTGLLPIVRAEGGPATLWAVGTRYRPGRTVFPHERFVKEKDAWPTYTGRQQFLIEHPWFEEAGESLPVHKEPPKSGGDHPLLLTGGHTRWSIHAIWRDSSLMLRLQRGEPVVYVSVKDARERKVADGDRIRVWSDLGAFEAMAKVAPAVRPGQVIVYHAWEPYQFPGWKGQQEPVAAPFKPLHAAGGYGQIHYRPIYSGPGHHPRAQRVDFARAEA
jgi:DMSO reductase family type II enzyme molybdopterin subunit